ncbi:helix-turn-helix domain-containing protein [Streptomyces avermitilis]
MSVSELAAHWQFADSSHFIRAVKGRYGQTPAEFARTVAARGLGQGADLSTTFVRGSRRSSSSCHPSRTRVSARVRLNNVSGSAPDGSSLGQSWQMPRV